MPPSVDPAVPTCVVVMGVSGAGKSTVARLLADRGAAADAATEAAKALAVAEEIGMKAVSRDAERLTHE